MAKKVVDITIGGMSLKIATEEDESYVKSLTDSIDSDIAALYEANPSISTMNAVLLCTLDYMDRYEKSRRDCTNLRDQMKEYLADSASSKLLLDEQRKKSEKLAEEVKSLKGKMSHMVAPESSEAAQKKAENISTALKEIEELRQVNDDALRQCRSLNDRITALNDFIANQDSELEKLRMDSDDKARLIRAREESLADAQRQIKSYKREINQLRSQLDAERARMSGDNQSDGGYDMPNLSWADTL